MVRPLKGIGIPRGPNAQAEGKHERGNFPSLVSGVWGISLEKRFKFKMSVEAILMHFETIFACEIRLIVQAFHVAVFNVFLTVTSTTISTPR